MVFVKLIFKQLMFVRVYLYVER